MKYTTEQLKDLIDIANNGCAFKACSTCSLLGRCSEKRRVLNHKIVISIHHPEAANAPSKEYAKNIIREVIEGNGCQEGCSNRRCDPFAI